jgi:Tfp pilus assembly protein PilX
MKHPRSAAAASGGRGDEGIALLTVVGTMMILSLFLLVGLNTAIHGLSVSRKGQDSNSATAAAQAGVDDFVQQMNLDLEMLPELGLNTWSAWKTVQGSANQDATYRYKVLSATGGQVLVQVEARNSVGGSRTSTQATQTLYATAQARSFLSYVYLSDIEVMDPQLVGSAKECETYYYAGRSALSGCGEIQWTTGDVVDGPLHSNDALQVNGAVQFKDSITSTAWPSAQGRTGLTDADKTWWGSQPAPLPGFPPRYDAALALPVSNAELLSYVLPKVDSSTNTTRPGCYYQGATKITFTGSTMTVHSPGTTRSDTPAYCYNVATPTAQQSGLPIPRVIYVDSGTATCTIGQVGYPMAGESYSGGSDTAASWGHAPNYACKRGTAYVSGTADARTTVAASDDIVVTGNLTVQDLSAASTDVVGLIAGNYVWVYNPQNSTSTNLLSGAARVTTIQAGILALRHSFLVQNWDSGAAIGTLNVTGAIAQKFRGPVGTGTNTWVSTGYLKNYVYDDRLQYLRPPYFIEPVGNTWSLLKTVTASSS